jgi:hypothetical protein
VLGIYRYFYLRRLVCGLHFSIFWRGVLFVDTASLNNIRKQLFKHFSPPPYKHTHTHTHTRAHAHTHFIDRPDCCRPVVLNFFTLEYFCYNLAKLVLHPGHDLHSAPGPSSIAFLIMINK